MITTKPIFEDAIPAKILEMSLFLFLTIYVVRKIINYIVVFDLFFDIRIGPKDEINKIINCILNQDKAS